MRILNIPLVDIIAEIHNMAEDGQSIIANVILNHINQWLEEGADELFPLTTVGDFLFRGITEGVPGLLMSYGLTNDRLPPTFRPENGFAFMNGKEDSSENQFYQVETSAESWNRHTIITQWGRDRNSLYKDLSRAGK